MIGENFAGKDMVLDILKKQPNGITGGERAILEARSGYLTEEERKRYGVAEFALKPEPEPKTKAKKK